jgi:hypothetical protein
MECGGVLPLGSDIRVANNTPVSHAGCAPERCVANTALTTDLCMRGNTAQGCACPGVERIRAEQHATLYKTESTHKKGYDYCGNDAGGGEKSQLGIFHHHPTLAK